MTTPETPGLPIAEVTTTVRELVQLMRQNGLTSVEVTVGDVEIKLKAGGVKAASSQPGPPSESTFPSTTMDVPEEAGLLISAPMIGTYYTSAGPGEPAFVRPGERVEIGQTIAIIEAMKIMNEIPSEHSGIVLEVLATNAQAVEYGSPLMRIQPDEFEG